MESIIHVQFFNLPKICLICTLSTLKSWSYLPRAGTFTLLLVLKLIICDQISYPLQNGPFKQKSTLESSYLGVW